MEIAIRLLQTQSDGRLVELAEGGSERAFEALVNRYRKPLLGYCRRLLLPEARAEDALQQGLLQAWLALEGGAEVRDAKAWLYRIVHNASVSALRRSGYDYVELDESLHGARSAEEDLDRRIAVRETLAGLAALPEAQREVLLRTALQGDSHEQVAASMGLSEGAVRGLVYRARASLRTAATALTPPQLLLWVSRAAESGGAHPQLAELVTAGGSAGLFGALLKGSAVLVSVGAIATGATLAEHHDGAAEDASAETIAGQTQAALASLQSTTIRAQFSSGGVLQAAVSSPLRGERAHRREHAGGEERGGRSHGGGRSGTDDARIQGDSGSSSSGDGASAGESSGGSSGSASGEGGAGSGSGKGADGVGAVNDGTSTDGGSSSGETSGSSSPDGGGGGPARGDQQPVGEAPPPAAGEVPPAPVAPEQQDSGSSSHSGGSSSPQAVTDGSSSGSGSGH